MAIAGSLNPGLSGWLPLARRVAEVGELGTVLVVGATGTSGRLAVQAAFEMGAARVVGIGRDPQRLADFEPLGAVPVQLADGPGAITAALADSDPSIVLDFVWSTAAEAVWESLGRRGLDEDTADIAHVQIGATGGATAALPAPLLRSRRFTVRGFGAGSAPLAEIMAALPRFMDDVADGRIVTQVRAFPLSRVAEAWAYTGPERAVVVPD